MSLEKAVETPLLFLVFNRPEPTARVFERIRAMRPATLYVSADGPRAGRDGEYDACRKVREIVKNVDWDCDTKYLFHDSNLGCKKGVSTGITWFFENEAEGIVLEDDCLPDPSFFQFCSELLTRYRDDGRIGLIAGTNYLGESDCEYDYFFSRHCPIWGWASWRRAWSRYDLAMHDWPEFKRREYMQVCFAEEGIRQFFTSIYDNVADNKIDTWDHQWSFTCRRENWLTAIPKRNLVTNIGFSTDATHTKDAANPLADRVSYTLDTAALRHPRVILPDPGLEQATSHYILSIMGVKTDAPSRKNAIRRVKDWIRALL